jgi:oligosaccharyltransferase complex subunit beta
MRWSFSSAAVLVWTAAVAAKSFTGDRLLVILEEQSEREKYSVFLEDLSGKSTIFLENG